MAGNNDEVYDKKPHVMPLTTLGTKPE